MEEEGGDDSEMIDAMDGWDSDQDDSATGATSQNPSAGTDDSGTGSDNAIGKKKTGLGGEEKKGVDGS